MMNPNETQSEVLKSQDLLWGKIDWTLTRLLWRPWLRTRPRVSHEIRETSFSLVFHPSIPKWCWLSHVIQLPSFFSSHNSIIFNCKACGNNSSQQASNQRDKGYYIIASNCLITAWMLPRFHLSEFLSELSKWCSSDRISVNFLKISGRWASADVEHLQKQQTNLLNFKQVFKDFLIQ